MLLLKDANEDKMVTNGDDKANEMQEETSTEQRTDGPTDME